HTRSASPGGVRAEPEPPLPGGPAQGLRACDLDNDGVPDLVTWSGRKLSIYRGSGSRALTPLGAPIELPAEIADVQAGDLDGDGDLDLLVSTPKGLFFVENKGGNANHWLDVRLRGR